jgi:hypothetical protein
MDALLGMAVVVTALLAVLILMLVFLLAWLISAKKSADSGIREVNEAKELNKQAIETSRRNAELQTEANQLLRELIDALRGSK